MPNKSFVEMGKEKKAIISHYDTCDVKILVIICLATQTAARGEHYVKIKNHVKDVVVVVELPI